ncbi:MAG: hypothetical protein RLY97_2172 [Pseudomonadota bacterium]
MENWLSDKLENMHAEARRRGGAEKTCQLGIIAHIMDVFGAD